MIVKVFIPYHPDFDKYLDKVVKQFSIWDGVITREADFKKEQQIDVRNEVKDIDADLVFTVDADEFLLKKDQERIVKDIDGGNHNGVFAYHLLYTPDLKNRYILDEQVIVAGKPDKIHFFDTRCCKIRSKSYKDINVHHLSYCFDEDLLEWKHKNYWDNGNPNNVKDRQDNPIEPYVLPDELKELLK